MIRLAATGHRPGPPGLDHSQGPKLQSFAEFCLRHHAPGLVLSGLALGWDTAIAEAALALGIPLVAVIPFLQQPSRWSTQAIVQWAALKRRASEVIVIAPEFSLDAYQRRNEYMVDRCNTLLALWNGLPGGTANCVNYAYRQKALGAKIKVSNVWGMWLEQG